MQFLARTPNVGVQISEAWRDRKVSDAISERLKGSLEHSVRNSTFAP
jgi:hypothetical protein